MAEQLSNYIEKEREKGFDDNKIKQALLKSGYSKDKIDKAFEIVGSEQEHKKVDDVRIDKEEKTEPTAAPEKHGGALKIVIALFILVALLLVVFGFFYMSGMLDNINLGTSGQDSAPPLEEIEPYKDDVQYYYDEHHNKLPVVGAGCEYPMKLKSRICRAILYDNTSICDRIEKESDKADCKEWVTLVWAVRDDDRNRCIQLTEIPKEMCVAFVAEDRSKCSDFGVAEGEYCETLLEIGQGIKTENTAVCTNNPFDDTFNDEEFKELCEAFVTNTADSCDIFYDMRCE